MTVTPVCYKLKNWRRNARLSQASAAEQLGVARRTWHQWEQGAVIPGPALMIALVKLTSGEVQPNDFYPLPAPAKQKAA